MDCKAFYDLLERRKWAFFNNVHFFHANWHSQQWHLLKIAPICLHKTIGTDVLSNIMEYNLDTTYMLGI